MTNLDFARLAAGIAREAASWTTELCEDAARPVRPGNVERFCTSIAERLQLLRERGAAQPSGNSEELERLMREWIRVDGGVASEMYDAREYYKARRAVLTALRIPHTMQGPETD